MSVFEVGKTISESVGGAAVAGGNSGLGNRFFFTDDTCLATMKLTHLKQES